MSSHAQTGLPGGAAALARQHRAGRVYRREDLASRSTAVDRHLRQLVEAGRLRKLAQGLYHAPKKTAFGDLPPTDAAAVSAFLRDKDFLVFSPSVYNAVGLGATQLYNRTWVYNHKRHGVFKLGNRQYDFRVKPRFPKKLTPEFLYVDMLNNLDELAEDRDAVLLQARRKESSFDPVKLRRDVEQYANAATRRRFQEWANG
jgi:hypothetical protein